MSDYKEIFDVKPEQIPISKYICKGLHVQARLRRGEMWQVRNISSQNFVIFSLEINHDKNDIVDDYNDIF